MQPLNPSENRTTYFINPNDSGETQRLLDMDHLTTAAMGGVFSPSHLAPRSGSTILDCACGPGGWTSKVAFEHSDCQVIGIDISNTMIRYAQAQAQAQKLHNLTFHHGSLLDPLPFADASCDFVNTRLASSFMPVSAWPVFIEECKRVVRPGGIIRVAEAEWIFTNSPAGEKLADVITHAQWLTGKSFSPDGKRFGCTLALPKFFRDAHLEQIEKQAYSLEFSFGTPTFQIWYQNLMAGLHMMRSFLLKTGVITNEAFESLYQQFDYEMQDPSFLGAFFLLSVWGVRP
jgi:ubiquinone/menaquinone biosynthesis C-methylase UbiE